MGGLPEIMAIIPDNRADARQYKQRQQGALVYPCGDGPLEKALALA
jgi:hypothetical protein